MDHEYITEFNLIDQYLLGRLATDEVEEFEAHFVDCPECVERLNISRSLIDDLKGFAAQETLRSVNAGPAPRQRWLVGQLRPLRIAGALALLIVGVFGFFGARRLIRLEAEVRQARQEASDINEQYRQKLGAAAQSAERDQQAKEELALRVSELERELDEVKTLDVRVPPAEKGPDAPEVNFPIFALVSVSRGQSGAPVNIPLTESTTRFALSVPIEDGRDFAAYRVKIVNRSGRTVWQRSGFRPDAYHSLTMSLRSSFLPTGSYNLNVEGLTTPGQWTIIGDYPFRVTRTPRR